MKLEDENSKRDESQKYKIQKRHFFMLRMLLILVALCFGIVFMIQSFFATGKILEQKYMQATEISSTFNTDVQNQNSRAKALNVTLQSQNNMNDYGFQAPGKLNISVTHQFFNQFQQNSPVFDFQEQISRQINNYDNALNQISFSTKSDWFQLTQSNVNNTVNITKQIISSAAFNESYQLGNASSNFYMNYNLIGFRGVNFSDVMINMENQTKSSYVVNFLQVRLNQPKESLKNQYFYYYQDTIGDFLIEFNAGNQETSIEKFDSFGNGIDLIKFTSTKFIPLQLNSQHFDEKNNDQRSIFNYMKLQNLTCQITIEQLTGIILNISLTSWHQLSEILIYKYDFQVQNRQQIFKNIKDKQNQYKSSQFWYFYSSISFFVFCLLIFIWSVYQKDFVVVKIEEKIVYKKLTQKMVDAQIQVDLEKNLVLKNQIISKLKNSNTKKKKSLSKKKSIKQQSFENSNESKIKKSQINEDINLFIQNQLLTSSNLQNSTNLENKKERNSSAKSNINKKQKVSSFLSSQKNEKVEQIKKESSSKLNSKQDQVQSQKSNLNQSIEKLMVDINQVKIKDNEIYESNVYEDESLTSINRKIILEEINVNFIKMKSSSYNSQKSDYLMTEINKNIRKIKYPYGSISINQNPKTSQNQQFEQAYMDNSIYYTQKDNYKHNRSKSNNYQQYQSVKLAQKNNKKSVKSNDGVVNISQVDFR